MSVFLTQFKNTLDANNVAEAHNIIQSMELNANYTLNILYRLSEYCKNPLNLELFPCKDMISLLNLYTEQTSTILDSYTYKEITKHFSYMYYIVKYLHETGNVDSINKFQSLLLIGINCEYPTKDEVQYSAVYYCLFKVLNETDNLPENDFFKLYIILLKMVIRSQGDFLKYVSNIFKCLRNKKYNTTFQLKCLQFVINLENLSNFDNNSSLYNTIFETIKLTIKYSIQRKEHNDISNALQHLLVAISRINSGDFVPTIIKTILAIAKVSKYSNTENTLKNVLNLLIIERNLEDKELLSSLCSLLVTIIPIWKNSKNFMQSCTQFNILVDINDTIFNIYLNSGKKCQCCGGRDFDLISNLIQTMVDILRASKQPEILSQLYNTLSTYTELLSESKNKLCNSLPRFWTICSISIYNITCDLIKLPESGTKFSVLLLKLFGKLGKPDKFLGGVETFMPTTINYLITKNDLANAQLLTAITVFLSPEHPTPALKVWCNVLYKLKGNTKIPTLVSTLNSNVELVREFIPNFTEISDRKEIVKLLQLELKIFHEKWLSRVNIISVIKELAKYTSDCSVLAKELMALDLDMLDNLDEEMIKLVKKLITNLKTSDVNNSKCYLATLYYCLFETGMNKLIKTNNEDMNNTIIPVKREVGIIEPIPDINDECDIVSSYASLAINKHKDLLKHLKTSFSYIEESLEITLDLSDQTKMYNLSLTLSHVLRLHCNYVLYEKALLLAKSFAEISNKDTLRILHCNGALLEKAHCTPNSKLLVQESDEILKKLNHEKSLEIVLCVVNYQVNLSCYYANNAEWLNAMQCYNLATELLNNNIVEKEDQKLFELVQIRLMVLKSQLSRAPCEMAMEKSPHVADMKPRKAMVALNAYISDKKNRKNHTFTISLYFEIIEDMMTRFYNLRLPRYIRCYAQEVVAMTQKLVLPLRTARILVHLARADVLAARVDDCTVKLAGICEILQLQNASVRCLTKTNFPVSADEKLPIVDVDSLAEDLHEMLLDVPQSQSTLLSLRGSPVFQRVPLLNPPFMTHPADCDCFECATPEYIELVLQKLHLDFQLSVMQSDEHASKLFYSSALSLYETVKNRARFSLVNFVDFRLWFDEVYCHLLLDNCNKQVLVDSDFALELNSSLQEVMTRIKSIDPIMITEAKMQRIDILLYIRESDKTEIKTVVLEEISDDSLTVAIEKTPENKILKTRSKTGIKNLTTPYFPHRIVKAVPFDLSDDEEDFSVSKSPKVLQTVSTNAILKTPKHGTFMIFDDSSSTSKLTKSVSTRKKVIKKALAVDGNKTKPDNESLQFLTDKKNRILVEKLKKVTESTRKVTQSSNVKHESINLTESTKKLTESTKKITQSAKKLTESSKKLSESSKTLINESSKTLITESSKKLNESSKKSSLTSSRLQESNKKSLKSESETPRIKKLTRKNLLKEMSTSDDSDSSGVFEKPQNLSKLTKKDLATPIRKSSRTKK